MLDLRKVVEICAACSPERVIPREMRAVALGEGLTRRVMSNPIPYALLLSVRRGGTFKDAA